jgi:ATP-dependent protease ClpP protease subunit
MTNEELNDLKADLVREEIEEKRRLNEWARADAEDVGVFTFYGAVKQDIVETTMTEMAHWSRRNQDAPLEVIMNSPGGSVLDGLCFYDFLLDLRAQGHPITIVGLGMVASMAGPLLQAADWRILGKSAYMLIHEVSASAVGTVSDMEDRAEFAKRLQKRLVAILAARSTLSERQIETRSKRKDWWFSADEALEMGFCDEVR